MGKLYTERLNDLTGLQLPLAKTDYADNIYWIYGVVLKPDVVNDVETLMQQLLELGVATRPFFWPMHEQPVFRKMGLFADTSCPVAEYVARHGFYLPSGLALTEQQIECVAKAMHQVLR